MFNLEVEGEHCYFVGEQLALVHNTNACPKEAKKLLESFNVSHFSKMDVDAGGGIVGKEIIYGAPDGKTNIWGFFNEKTGNLYIGMVNVDEYYKGHKLSHKLYEGLFESIGKSRIKTVSGDLMMTNKSAILAGKTPPSEKSLNLLGFTEHTYDEYRRVSRRKK